MRSATQTQEELVRSDLGLLTAGIQAAQPFGNNVMLRR